MKRPRPGPLRLGAGPVRFEIHAPDRGYHAFLKSFFRSFGPPPERPTGRLRYRVDGGALYRGETLLGRFRRPLRAASRMVLDLGEQVPLLAGPNLCLHSGAIASRGRALLLPGGQKGGKSTLTLGMVRRGCTYYSDDIAILGAGDGRLSAFPRPVDLRAADLFPRLGGGLKRIPAGRGDRGRASIRVDRRRTGRARARIRWIVFPHVRLGGPTECRPIPRGEALLRLCRLAFNLHRLGKEGFEVLVDLIRGADCYALEVGRLPGGLRALSRIMEMAPREGKGRAGGEV